MFYKKKNMKQLVAIIAQNIKSATCNMDIPGLNKKLHGFLNLLYVLI